jgi:F0F1-type ATP synthase epsilon subunit
MMLEPTIEELILSGVVEVSSVDPDSGELLYSFTNKLHEVMPEFLNRKLDFVKQEVDFFIETGFLEVNDPRAQNPIIFLTDKAFDEEEVADLSKNKQKSLKEIKRLFEER